MLIYFFATLATMATNTENDVQGSIPERNELSVYFSLNNDVIFKLFDPLNVGLN